MQVTELQVTVEHQSMCGTLVATVAPQFQTPTARPATATLKRQHVLAKIPVMSNHVLTNSLCDREIASLCPVICYKCTFVAPFQWQYYFLNLLYPYSL